MRAQDVRAGVDARRDRDDRSVTFSIPVDAATSLDLLAEDDAEELYALIGADRERLSQWLPWTQESTLETTRDFIHDSLRRFYGHDGFDLGIRHEGRLVGMIGLHYIDHHSLRTSIGYWIAASAQGRGIVSGATRALVSYCFGVLALHRVEIRVAPGNLRSRAVPERLQFQEDGILREYERVGDRWVDLVVYSMLAREWRSLDGRQGD